MTTIDNLLQTIKFKTEVSNKLQKSIYDQRVALINKIAQRIKQVSSFELEVRGESIDIILNSDDFYIRASIRVSETGFLKLDYTTNRKFFTGHLQSVVYGVFSEMTEEITNIQLDYNAMMEIDRWEDKFQLIKEVHKQIFDDLEKGLKYSYGSFTYYMVKGQRGRYVFTEQGSWQATEKNYTKSQVMDKIRHIAQSETDKLVKELVVS